MAGDLSDPSTPPPPTPRNAAPPLPSQPEQIVEEVRQRYGRIAEGIESGCCGPAAAGEAETCKSAESTTAQRIGYGDTDLAALPEGANLGLGCGAPVDRLDLHPGETVLDLGSGAGVDAFLAARRVGPNGRVIGVDMTPAMLHRARANAALAGHTQVEFREGRLEALPIDDSSVDAVTSNCVINLVPDKAAVFREVARVLRPGGRIVISDIILDGSLPHVVATDLMAYVGCIAGALDRRAYFAHVAAAGLSDVRLLKDVDYLAAVGFALPEGLRDRMDLAGVTDADLAGKVRSVTFRAIKAAA
jgi:SAM-dependent methyltransferase